MRGTRVYDGMRAPDGTTQVTVNGSPLDPRIHFRVQTTTFDWGYAGAGGPAQLSLAILSDYLGEDDQARRYYEDFVRRVIRWLPSPRWTLNGSDIDDALTTGR